VQGVMEPSYRARSYLGKTMRVEGRVSKFFFPIHPNLRDKIHFKGVGL
jgi:hypothetical protein